MLIPSGAITLVKSPRGQRLQRLLCEAQRNLLLASPFVKSSQCSQVLSCLRTRGVHNNIEVDFITDIRPESVLNGASDLEAFLDLGKNLSGFNLTHLPSLHAKVYIADTKMAVVTSGNLTNSGISGQLQHLLHCP
jgi:phosphatidylserine/phosphatidylglycerophosphate/cardiolipin synthase-like enzyme